MVFKPQYGGWGRETFDSAEDAIILNTGQFEIIGGVTKLIPLNFGAGVHTFNAPWDPVTGWTINNTMDSEAIVDEDFHRFEQGDSTHGNIGTIYRTSFYTSGQTSCFVYNIGTGNPAFPDLFGVDGTGQLTIEFSARTISEVYTGNPDAQQPPNGRFFGSGDFNPRVSHHGVYIGDSNAYTFVEVSPAGLQVRSTSGAAIPSDYGSSLTKARIVIHGGALTVMAEDGSNLYVASGFKQHTNVGQTGMYIAFGSFPQVPNLSFTGGPGDQTFHVEPGIDVASFAGTTMWDDVKIAVGQAVSRLPSDFLSSYPLGVKTLYTAPWFPNKSVNPYLTAYVTHIPITGGVTIVQTQSFQPDTGVISSYGVGNWFDVGNPINLTYNTNRQIATTNPIDLTAVTIFDHPHNNALRWKIESESLGGAPSEIDSITVVGQLPAAAMDAIPNWKLSAMSKDIFFKVNRRKHEKEIPPAHHQDHMYFHNEEGKAFIGLSGQINSNITNSPGGTIRGKLGFDTDNFTYGRDMPTGLVRVSDGVYGDAWRNFSKVGNYINSIWDTPSVYDVDWSGVFQGTLKQNLVIYPTGGFPPVSGAAEVIFSVLDYSDLGGDVRKVQECTVVNYYKQAIAGAENQGEHLGFALPSMSIPLKSLGRDRQFGVIEGVIEIPQGPGVVVSLHEWSSKNTTFLKGENYRQATRFSCVALYTGDHSDTTTATYASFGVLPRPVQAVAQQDEFGVWKSEIEEHAIDRFILHSVTGYMVDHTHIFYSGFDANLIRSSNTLDARPWWAGVITAGEINVKNFREFNEQVAPLVGPISGFTPLHRNSLVFEGWFRPYGIASSGSAHEGVLAQVLDSNRLGMRLWLNRDGNVRAEIDRTLHYGASGDVSDRVYSHRRYEISSTNSPIKWGEWNHIGVVTDVKAMGDAEGPANYPAVPALDENTPNLVGFDRFETGSSFRLSPILHGARSARAYLEVNEYIVDSEDISDTPYHGYFITSAGIKVQLPRIQTHIQNFPKIPRFAGSGDYEVTIGQQILGDFDHVRFGVRDKADPLINLFVKGSKATPPLLNPKDAIRPFPATSGGVSHMELAHIYRLDQPMKYVGWDDGFAVAHATVETATGDSSLEGYNFDANFFLKKVPGPDGRTALRIGPGARLVSPWSSMNERLFNGTGTYSAENDGEKLFVHASGAGVHIFRSYEQHALRQGYAFSRSVANGHIRMGGKFRLRAWPTTGVMDLLTYDEVPHVYGRAQVFCGINTSGHVVAGTRYKLNNAGGSQIDVDLGPFEGIVINTGEWTNIGIDAALRENGTFNVSDKCHIRTFVSGQSDINQGIICFTGGHNSVFRGFPLGYGGLLDPAKNESVFRVGGNLPTNEEVAFPTWKYSDYDVCDWIIGFGLGMTGAGESYWNWTGYGGQGVVWPGLDELAVVDGDILGPVSGFDGYFTGVVRYPATPFSDAGEKTLWITANRGNDYEGFLQNGTPLFDDGTFINAASYFALYENDNAAEVLGSTDSPIQLAKEVPPDAVNLALVSIAPWTNQETVTRFDLSDRNPNNITPKIHGDQFVTNFTTGNVSVGMVSRNQLDSDDIRVTSTALYRDGNPNTFAGYFVHLIGGENKGVFVDNATTHQEASVDNEAWFKNLDRVKAAIQIKNGAGDDIPFDVFPYDLIPSPYSARLDNAGITGYRGLVGEEVHLAGISNADKVYTVALIANAQSIGQSVFIHYPSKDYVSNNVNLLDKDVYNPVPLMKEILEPIGLQRETFIRSGYYSTRLSAALNAYDITIWHGTLTPLYTNDNQEDL